MTEKFMFIIARVFGKRIMVNEIPKGDDAGVQLTGYKFKGRLYVTNFSYYFDR